MAQEVQLRLPKLGLLCVGRQTRRLQPVEDQDQVAPVGRLPFAEDEDIFRVVLFLLILPYYRIQYPTPALVGGWFEGGQTGVGWVASGLVRGQKG